MHLGALGPASKTGARRIDFAVATVGLHDSARDDDGAIGALHGVARADFGSATGAGLLHDLHILNFEIAADIVLAQIEIGPEALSRR